MPKTKSKPTSKSELQKRLRVVVGTNTLTEVYYEAYTNHCQMWFRFGRSYPHIDFTFVATPRMSIDRYRNLCAKTALDVEADYLLFLDDDVLVQPDGLAKLLAANADIAAGKVVIRGYPFDWMIFKRVGKAQDGLQSVSKLPETGIYECGAVGFSFCLIKVDLLKRVPDPWFVTGVSNTEDIYFCVKALQAKPDVRIVCECSVLCGHMLWPEFMDPRNRDIYKKYFEKLNPQALADKKKEKLLAKTKDDRGQEYLNFVKESFNVKA